jgi:glutamine amidotransferase
MVKTAIVNYGLGNLRSVANAVEAVGHEPYIAASPDMLDAADSIILPGVGAFGDAMRRLADAGWREELEKQVQEKGKPLLGLCLGMQVLASIGTEHGVNEGLGWIPGSVVRLPTERCPRIPHIGWNDVRFTGGARLYAELGESGVFYFVHSYVFQPEDPRVITGVCEYGGDFVASVEAGNIFATQFHPEKSQKEWASGAQRTLPDTSDHRDSNLRSPAFQSLEC